MRLAAALAATDARVRERPLRRDLAWAFGPTGPYAVVHPVAPPRLWGLVAQSVLGAMHAALASQAPSDATLRAAVEAAAAGLARLREQLIEPELTLDAQLGLLAGADGAVHGALSSGVRLYRARGGVPERLHSNAPRPRGIAHGMLHTFAEPLAPGDLFVLGTRETFTVRAIGNLASALARSNAAPVEQLCEGVVGPAREVGIASAVVVLRAG